MIAGVDIGGTKIAVGMIDDTGKIISRAESPTNADRGYPEALKRTEAMLFQVSKEIGASITGIGIGSTGPINPQTGEIGDVNFLPGWEGANPVRDLSQKFKVSAAIENDADAAALAEGSWGAGKNKKRLIYITVGTGIGAGLIFDGQLYRGVEYAHPEIGHHVVDSSGPECLCGFRGCWESLAAGPAMVHWIKSNAPQAYVQREDFTAKHICDLARAGDEWALRAVQHEGHYLGLGLANIVTLFTPDAIVLGGSVMKSADLFLDVIQDTIRRSCRYVPWEKTTIALASLGEDANLIGAARVWHHRFDKREGHSV